jgi:hypothetical protein
MRQGLRHLAHHDRELRIDEPGEPRRQREVANTGAGLRKARSRIFEHGSRFRARPVPFVRSAQAHPGRAGAGLLDQELAPIA